MAKGKPPPFRKGAPPPFKKGAPPMAAPAGPPVQGFRKGGKVEKKGKK